MELNPTRPEYLYVQAADLITARIRAGHYRDRLPSELALARELGISLATIRHATDLLRRRGLILSLHGRGTFVAPNPEAAPGKAGGAS